MFLFYIQTFSDALLGSYNKIYSTSHITMIITVKVIPKSSRDEVIKISDDQFKIKTTIAPEKGKANKKVIELLSTYFNTPKSNIAILRGKINSLKIIEIN